MINWYVIGNINEIASSELPLFEAPYLVENVQPAFMISNTINEDGAQYDAKGIVQYNGENLTIPFEDNNQVYESQSGLYGLKVTDRQLLLGVKQ